MSPLKVLQTQVCDIIMGGPWPRNTTYFFTCRLFPSLCYCVSSSLAQGQVWLSDSLTLMLLVVPEEAACVRGCAGLCPDRHVFIHSQRVVIWSSSLGPKVVGKWSPGWKMQKLLSERTNYQNVFTSHTVHCLSGTTVLKIYNWTVLTKLKCQGVRFQGVALRGEWLMPSG